MKKSYLIAVSLFLCGCEKVITPSLPDLNKEYIKYDDVIREQQELEGAIERVVY